MGLDESTILASFSNWALADLSDCYLPATGPFARDLFPKHMEFIRDTKDNSVCSAFGGNRVGKTMLLAYCDSVFATGIYPEWWEGRRFDRPCKLWVCGEVAELLIAAKQQYLIGKDGRGGFIPAANIKKVHWSSHIKGFADRVDVIHQPTGYVSEIHFKTYREGWRQFQTAAIDVVDLDEECDAKIYSEAVTRTATTNGLVMIGFTALRGLTPLVCHLLPQFAGADDETAEELTAERSHVFIGWNDIPESVISAQKRKELSKNWPREELNARMNGVPMIGQGLVYAVDQGEFVVEPFEVPEEWPRVAALDPGGTPGGDGKTAAIWCAHDVDNDCLYVYGEYYTGFKPVDEHARQLARRGRWIPLIIDPAGANITDGKGVKAEYVRALHELNEYWAVHSADKRFALGRMDLFNRLTSGGAKVFSTCRDLLGEHRQYIIGDNGQYQGAHHLWDCFRYASRGIGKAKLRKEVEHQMRRPAPVVRETTFGFFGRA